MTEIHLLFHVHLSPSLGQVATPSLWCGTNAGSIYIYVVGVPSSDNRTQDAVTAEISQYPLNQLSYLFYFQFVGLTNFELWFAVALCKNLFGVVIIVGSEK